MANYEKPYPGSRHTCTQMRPQIPQPLVYELERKASDMIIEDEDGYERSMMLYEIGGYNTKGEFVRAAVRDKVEDRVDKFNIE